MNKITDVGTIKETNDYSLFSFIKGNREINRTHVNKLKDKINKRDLFEIPLLVGDKDRSGKYPIIDGQHRFTARSELKKAIRFIIVDRIKSDDISLMNTNNANWVNKNFLNKYVEQGNKHYIYYKSFMQENGLKNLFSVCTTILNNSGRRIIAHEKDFVEGNFKVNNKEISEQNINFINLVLSEINSNKCKNSFFYFALLHSIYHPGFNRKHFLNKVRKLSAKFKGATNSTEWLDIIDTVYNRYNQGIKNFKPIIFKNFKTNI
jgi:hypothetical protein